MVNNLFSYQRYTLPLKGDVNRLVLTLKMNGNKNERGGKYNSFG